MKYADIIVDISLEALDRVFQYLVPEELKETLKVGSQVWVPFGRGNRRVKGYIVGFSEETDYAPEKLKSVLEPAANAVTVESQMICLADWMSQVYGCTRAQALKTVLNVKRRVRGGTKKVYYLAVSREAALEEMEKLARQPRFGVRSAVLAALLERDAEKGIEDAELAKLVPTPENALKTLKKHGWIQEREASDYRIPFRDICQDKSVVLNEAQKKVVGDIEADERQVHLLYGVTGSGKTEVYMALMERVIDSGRQAILLIPEISLTYQNIGRFRSRFGSRVSIMNSRMSEGERYDQYVRAKNGEIDIIIGPRSALFAPFPNLGLIIIDEAHDGAYKSDTMPKYHAVDVAIHRAAMNGARVVLGSATPSVVTYDRALRGIYGLHRLPERAAGAGQMAETEIVDLREELKAGNYSIFSRELQEEMGRCLEKKEQILLFLNRRGYAGFVSCRSCGHVMVCDHCDVSMTLHKNEGNVLKCHYCGSHQPMPEKCPECGSPYIGTFGIGTQKVVELLQKLFPEARVLRADRDTMGRKYQSVDIFRTFAEGGADILVGTQMIVKGHDFPNVTLVGVLAADMSMFAGDYLAGERTFQLLTQAAGRAGRGAKAGKVIIQTYQPDNDSLVYAAAQDYEGFYAQEILYRKMMDYPPAGHMMVAVVESEEEAEVLKAAGDLSDWLRSGGFQALPPADGFRAKEKDVYRKVIYIKSSSVKVLLDARNRILEMSRQKEIFKKSMIQFDIDPINLY